MYVQTAQSMAAQILPADTTTKKTLYTAGTQGGVVESLGATNTDTAAATVLQLYVNDGSIDHLIGTVNVPISSGNIITVPTVDILRNSQIPQLEFDAFGNKVIKLKAGYILKVAATVTVNSGKAVDVVGHGGDF
jgi:hypothetical protein